MTHCTRPSSSSLIAPWSALDRAATHDAELSLRFACLSHVLMQGDPPGDGEARSLQLSTHWKVSGDCRDLARLLLSLPAPAGIDAAGDAEAVLQLLLASDALRRPGRFRQWLKACTLVDDSEAAAAAAANLSCWLDVALDVNTAAAASAAATRGLGGADLGVAVLEARREAVAQAMAVAPSPGSARRSGVHSPTPGLQTLPRASP